MTLSKAKLAKIQKAKREEYVYDRSITGNTHNPFLDANWNEAARKYIETGEESLRLKFPNEIRRGRTLYAHK